MSVISTLTSAFSTETAALAERLNRLLVTVRSEAGGGSGTAWTTDGLIVTNHHVAPDETATVILHDGSEHDARVVGRDPSRDLALLRVDANLTEIAEPGDSRGVRTGQLVFAIGNPWGQRGTLTSGIVLATGPIPDNPAPNGVIRADVRLAPGNSGGPLVDASGKVIGINSMIAGGMAVAIPSHDVVEFVADALGGAPGYLGITLQPVAIPEAIAASYKLDEAAALMLTGIEPGSAAEAAGLLPGDVILGVGQDYGVHDVGPRLKAMRAGKPVHLTLMRAGKPLETTAIPAARL